MPKSELGGWLAQLDSVAREYVKRRLGLLVHLLEVRIRTGLIQAIAHFWCPETSTFIFGRHELTPTLEEYSVLIGKSLDSEPIGPYIGTNPQLLLAEFLKIEVAEARKVLKSSYENCPFSFLTECFNRATSLQKGKIFLLAFFGLVVFPHCKNSINPEIVHLVQQVCEEKNFVNTMLAETFISLNKYKRDKSGTFKAPAELLQIWFLSHIKGCQNLVTVQKLRNFSPPIMVFKEKQNEIPDYHFSEWIGLLEDPDPRGFQWQAKWFEVKTARLTSSGTKPIPLLGFTGATEYHPLRVTRQYKVVQTLPPPLEAECVRLDFTNKIPDHEHAVITVRTLWDFCRPTKLKLPRKDLLGDEKMYHATPQYIKKHSIPEALRPIIPEVRPTATLHAQVEDLQRELEKEKRKAAEAIRALKRMKSGNAPLK